MLSIAPQKSNLHPFLVRALGFEVLGIGVYNRLEKGVNLTPAYRAYPLRRQLTGIIALSILWSVIWQLHSCNQLVAHVEITSLLTGVGRQTRLVHTFLVSINRRVTLITTDRVNYKYKILELWLIKQGYFRAVIQNLCLLRTSYVLGIWHLLSSQSHFLTT